MKGFNQCISVLQETSAKKRRAPPPPAVRSSDDPWTARLPTEVTPAVSVELLLI